MQLAERAGQRAFAQPIEPQPEPETEPRRPDPEAAFTRLARLVKEITAVISRLDAGLPAESPRSEAWQTLTDPRRQHIIRTVHEAIKNSPHPKPEQNAIRQQVEYRTQEFLANDPGQTLPAAVAIMALCEEFNLPFDIHKVPDEVLLVPGASMPAPDPQDDLSEISRPRRPP